MLPAQAFLYRPIFNCQGASIMNGKRKPATRRFVTKRLQFEPLESRRLMIFRLDSPMSVAVDDGFLAAQDSQQIELRVLANDWGWITAVADFTSQVNGDFDQPSITEVTPAEHGLVTISDAGTTVFYTPAPTFE